MIVSTNHNLKGHFIIKNQRIKQLQKYCYLGITINEDQDHLLRIKCKKACQAFRKMSVVLKCHNVFWHKNQTINVLCFHCITNFITITIWS